MLPNLNRHTLHGSHFLRSTAARLVWRFTVGALIVLLLGWVFRTISWRATWATLTNLSLLDLVWLAIVNALVFSTFTARWWLFLRALGHRIHYLRLVRYRLTAFGISYFTPGPHFGGEPYQVYRVVQQHHVPTTDAVAAVALDKLLEMLVNFAFLAGGTLVLARYHAELPPLLRQQLTVYALILLALPCLILLSLLLGRHPISGLLARLGKYRWAQMNWLQTLRHSEEQASWLCRHQPRILWLAVAVSIVSWLGIIGEFWLLTRLLDLPISFTDSINGLVAARVAILLPLPAALGTLEAGQALAMGSLGLPLSYGASIALLIRARDVVTGLFGLLLGGWQSLRNLTKDDTQQRPQVMPAHGDQRESDSHESSSRRSGSHNRM